MDQWTNGWIYEYTDGMIDEQTNEWTNGCVKEWMDR